jgi:hypothetical protein
MEIAQRKDSVKRVWSHVASDERGQTMTINFVLLRSPLLASRDPDTIVVSRE